MNAPPDTKKILLVHGRDHKARRAVVEFLASLGIMTMPWREAKSIATNEHGTGSPSILQIITTGMSACRGLVVLFTPDDFAHLREDLWGPNPEPFEWRSTGQPRQNVLFEAGAATALYPDRTIIVQIGHIRPASDLDGIYRIRLGSDESRRLFRQAIRDVGCKVDPDNSDWLREGKFVEDLQSNFDQWAKSDYSWKYLLTERDLDELHPKSAEFEPSFATYALISAIQHGYDVPIWLEVNRKNLSAAQALVDSVLHGPHRQPRLRAARALEAIDLDLVSSLLAQVHQADVDLPDSAWTLIEAVKENAVARLVRDRAEQDWDLADWQVAELLAQFKDYPTRRVRRFFDVNSTSNC